MTRSELDKMTGGAVHQGVAIEVPPYEYVDVDDLVDIAADSVRPGLIVALDSVTDPHNLGAVMRSAAAFRADGILIPERRTASVNATVWKVSAGAAARLPVWETNLIRSLKYLRSRAIFVVGLAGDGEINVADFDMATVPLVLVTGSEGEAFPASSETRATSSVSIPIDIATESLNAAVATGIALYAVDQDRKAGTANRRPRPAIY